jgi:hypothetical protein
MALVNFTNLDFDQIKESIKDYLRSNSNFTDYNFEGSNLSTIIDVLAYNTYITSYNANMVANEVFIDSATLRENVISLARNIGYIPRSRKSSSSIINFFVDTSDFTIKPSTLTLKKGIVASTNSAFGNQSFVFSILDDITVPVLDNIALFNNIKIYEGVRLSDSFTFTTNILNQKFILPNSGIDTDLISVTVRNSEQSTRSVKYNFKEDIFDIDGESKIFFLQEIEDERYEIIFGDGIFGKKLEENDFITISYITSNGDLANGISNFVFAGTIAYNQNNVEYKVTSGISLLTSELPSTGGKSIEPIESVKKYAPRIYSSQNRAVTISDYESLIPTKVYPETESISVFGGEELNPPQYGKVFISIKPKFGDFLPDIIKQNIKSELKKYTVAGIVTEILDLRYIFIEVNSKVYYNSNLAPSSQFVSSIMQNNVEKYSNSSELNNYGSRFKYSKFLKIIDESHESITSNITTVEMRRDLRIVRGSFVEYEICFGNEIHIKNSEGYNIKTSFFRVSGILGDVYISDIPNFDKKTGSLFMFAIGGDQSTDPTIVRKNVGTIDYKKGEIIVFPINIIDSKIRDDNYIIEFSAIPKSNDVIGLQQLYLQLDISRSNFEFIVDNITSSFDSSGSNYIVSSSYANGNLIRK